MRFAAEILTLLAGAFVGAVLRRKGPEPGGGWRTELEDLDKRLSSRMEMHGAGLAELGGKIEATASARDLGEIERRLGELERRIESAVSEFARQPDLAAVDSRISGAVARQEGRIVALEQAVSAHARKWESADRLAAALEERLGAAMAEMDRRLASQGDRIEALSAAAADTGGTLARVLDSVQSLSRIASERAEPLRVRTPEPAALASLIADEAGVGTLRHIRL